MRKALTLLLAALLCATLPFAAACAEATGIAGSDVQALLSDLEAFGIPTPEAETSGGLSVWKTDDVTVDKVECGYEIKANAEGEIVTARFTMKGKNALFQHVASLSYDAADSDRAVKFVKSNIGKANATVIGDAQFSLDVGDGLLITPSGIRSYKSHSLQISYSDLLTSGKGVIAKVTKGVNLRAEPNSDSARVGFADAGEELLVTAPYFTEKWHQINYNGQICYVSAKYCEIAQGAQ